MPTEAGISFFKKHSIIFIFISHDSTMYPMENYQVSKGRKIVMIFTACKALDQALPDLDLHSGPK
jgi:hypothetical protein